MNHLNEQELRLLMGPRVFGLAEWAALFNAYPLLSDAQRETLSITPWTQELLEKPDPHIPHKRIKDTHSAFIGFHELEEEEVTIPFLQRLQSTIGRKTHISITPDRVAHRDTNFSEEQFLKQTCRLRWYLMPLVVPMTFRNKSFDALKNALGETNKYEKKPYEAYEAVDAIVKVTQIVLYHQKTGEYPSQYEVLRCNDLLSTGKRVAVWSDSGGIHIGSREDGKEYSSLALALEYPDVLLTPASALNA